MSKLGERLKEERVRLGLSQSAFAERLGIHRNTQIKYESGAREPDSSYLEAISRFGVNTQYVMGIHDLKPSELLKMTLDEARIDTHLPSSGLGILLDVLEVSEEAWNEITASLITIHPKFGVPSVVTIDPAWGQKVATASQLITRLVESASALDSSLLAGILEGVDAELLSQSKAIEPAKKAQTVAMLYRAFKASGKVDPAMIEEAVTLAAG